MLRRIFGTWQQWTGGIMALVCLFLSFTGDDKAAQAVYFAAAVWLLWKGNDNA